MFHANENLYSFSFLLNISPNKRKCGLDAWKFTTDLWVHLWWAACGRVASSAPALIGWSSTFHRHRPVPKNRSFLEGNRFKSALDGSSRDISLLLFTFAFRPFDTNVVFGFRFVAPIVVIFYFEPELLDRLSEILYRSWKWIILEYSLTVPPRLVRTFASTQDLKRLAEIFRLGNVRYFALLQDNYSSHPREGRVKGYFYQPLHRR